MADFSTALQITLQNEGGHSTTNPPTYRGIYAGSEPGKYWKGWKILENYHPHFNQIFNDPELEKFVADFYKNYFWSPFNLGDINEQKIANFVFDWLVNTNPQKVSRILNTLLNLRPFTALKKESIDAINNLSNSNILNTFIEARVQFLKGLKHMPQLVRNHLIERSRKFV
jgi:hypothetical protein